MQSGFPNVKSLGQQIIKYNGNACMIGTAMEFARRENLSFSN